MPHARSWRIVSNHYSSGAHLVVVKECDACGKQRKRRQSFAMPPSSDHPLRPPDGPDPPEIVDPLRSDGDTGLFPGFAGFLAGIGFAAFVYAVATLRGSG